MAMVPDTVSTETSPPATGLTVPLTVRTAVTPVTRTVPTRLTRRHRLRRRSAPYRSSS